MTDPSLRRFWPACLALFTACGGSTVDTAEPDAADLTARDAAADARPDAVSDAGEDAPGRLDAGGDAEVAKPPGRALDPVVLSGREAGAFRGTSPAALVGFAYRDGAWAPIPIQIDERREVDLGAIYGQAATGITASVYADARTSVGADPDPGIDDDDEIAFMAADAAERATATTRPTGTLAGSGVEVKITDPANPQSVAYAYLFRQDGSLDQTAGRAYVRYTAGSATASVTTDVYAEHFVGRWVKDELRIAVGSGVDILDQNKTFFAPGAGCGENELSFNDGEGAFIAQRSGAVRAIRSYVGAQSGPYTQRDHLLYRAREDVHTFLRVHVIPSILDLVGYSAEAKGMRYFNSTFLAGDVIDGVAPSPAPSGQASWELVTGAPGSLVFVHGVDTDVPSFAATTYYDDDASDDECTPSRRSFGLSGPFLTGPIPCTDPTLSCSPRASTVVGRRVAYFGGPGWSTGDAAKLANQANVPLQAELTAAPF